MKLVEKCVLLTLIGLSSQALAQTPPRAKPPKFTTAEENVFFDDAFQHLSGERPAFTKAVDAATEEEKPTSTARDAKWSQLIDAATLETEIKRQAQRLAAATETATTFKGGGYKECRDALAVLATAFAVTEEYDEEVRWQDIAAGLRDLLARASANCKVGTDQSFREAALRATELSELVQGNRPSAPEGEADVDWSHIAPRGPLMRRMELAEQERLGPSLASAQLFKKQTREVQHEAQVLAMLAATLTQSGSEDGDDETYAEFARTLGQNARDIADSPTETGYEAARAALGKASKACADCHDSYRG
jgi:hypothetical protein